MCCERDGPLERENHGWEQHYPEPGALTRRPCEAAARPATHQRRQKCEFKRLGPPGRASACTGCAVRHAASSTNRSRPTECVCEPDSQECGDGGRTGPVQPARPGFCGLFFRLKTFLKNATRRWQQGRIPGSQFGQRNYENCKSSSPWKR